MFELIGQVVVWLMLCFFVYVISDFTRMVLCKEFEVPFKYENWIGFFVPIISMFIMSYFYWEVF